MRLAVESLETSTLPWKELSYAGGRPQDSPFVVIPHRIFRTIRSREALRDLLDTAIAEVHSCLPAGWFDAAQSPGTSCVDAAEELILQSLGWTLQRKRYVFSSLTVKAGTLTQLHQKEIPQLHYMTAFAALISNETRVEHVQKMMARMWALPCDGRALAPLWYLVLNGVASAERMESLKTRPCGCTHVGPDRVHLFHECPILQPALESVQAQFQAEWALPSPTSLQRHHLWLAVRPHRHLHQGIWDIVVVYLITAFDKARRNWTDRVLQLTGNSQQPRRSSRHRSAMPPGPEMVESVGRVVVTEFWSGLAEYAALGTLPVQWLSVVALDHPFIRPDPERRAWIISHLE